MAGRCGKNAGGRQMNKAMREYAEYGDAAALAALHDMAVSELSDMIIRLLHLLENTEMLASNDITGEGWLHDDI